MASSSDSRRGPTGAKIGRYRIKGEIARGGNATLYRAWDPELRRQIALKVLSEGEARARTVERLHREAAIGARLSHPNVVTVHEVGIDSSIDPPAHFIAMEYIEGPTLGDLLERRTESGREPHARPESPRSGSTQALDGPSDTSGLVAILETVARAVGFAHERGVVHRDLKPANVLVSDSGRVVLTDFGLARAEAFATRLTESHALLGTPYYMAPEQVEGQTSEIDARTDVYALGVILYEILAGRPPFVEERAGALFRRILGEDPPPIPRRVPPVPGELEAICRKAMSRSKASRYASGTEMAEDIHRYLRGDSPRARPPSRVRKVSRALARRRLALALAGTAGIGIAAAGYLASTLRSEQSEKRAALGEAEASREYALEQLSRRTGIALAAALELRRAGKPEAMERFGAEVESACREAAAALPDAPEPFYHLGRMERARMRTERALAQQDRALERDANFAPALYERIVLLVQLYRVRAAEVAERSWLEDGLRWSPAGARARVGEDERARALSTSVREDLARLEAAALRRPGSLTEKEIACTRGLLAWIEADPGRALSHLSLAAREAELEEAVEALATLELECSRFDESVAAWTAGVERDPGYLPYWEGRARARIEWANQERSQGRDPTDLFAAAERDLTFLLEHDPSRAVAWRVRGHARENLAIHAAAARRDAAGLFEQAARDYEEAARLEPRLASAWVWLGISLASWGLHEAEHGRDGVPFHERALPCLDRALDLEPGWFYAWSSRGTAWFNRAVQEFALGRDPLAFHDRAIQDFDRALELQPDPEARLTRARTHADRALALRFAGRDPLPAFDAALSDFDLLIEASPDRDDLRRFRGTTLGHRARYDLDRRSPEAGAEWLEKALLDLDRTVERDAASADDWIARADVTMNWAMGLEGLGLEAAPAYLAAVRDFAEGLALDPSRGQDRLSRARALRSAADEITATEEDAGPLYEEALAELALVLENDPSPARVWLFLGTTSERLARLRGGDDLELERAIGAFEEASRLDPSLAAEVEPLLARCREALGR